MDWLSKKNIFLSFQGALLLVVLILLFRRKPPVSQFKEREFERIKSKTKKAETKAPLLLTGFPWNGSPYEILGIPREADQKAIQLAYRKKMKQYHPDGFPKASQAELDQIQKMTQLINAARDQALRQLKKTI